MSVDVKVVIGSNFGDEGKGMMTDYFCHHTNKVLNVRYNGGSQAGHTCELKDGRKHVFSHFGSGSFNNVDTYLTEDFIINPIMFRVEFEKLKKLGIYPNVYFNINSRFTIPQDMMINQIVEKRRGKDKHGSCGLGIYETIVRYNENDNSKDWILNRLKNLGIENLSIEEIELLNNENIIKRYEDDYNFFISHAILINEPKNLYSKYNRIVFEGAQGLLLDQNNTDYFPHLTPSNTGLDNVLVQLEYINDPFIEVCYVTRSYFTRHGAGKFLTECQKELVVGDYVDTTNKTNEYQDSIRYGYFDIDTFLKYTNNDFKKIENKYLSKKTVAITHLNITGRKIITKNGFENLDIFYDNFYSVYKSNGKTKEDIS